MTLKKSYPLFAFFLLAALCVAPTAHANPLFYSNVASTNTATTTISYITPGAATTTLIYDSYSSGRNQASDRAALAIQFTASSTSSVLNTSFEYGIGSACDTSPDNCDWFKDNRFINATSTASAVSVTLPNSYAWTFASTSQGGAVVAASNNRGLKLIDVLAMTRYTRAIFSMTGANGAVWAQFIPVKQNP